MRSQEEARQKWRGEGEGEVRGGERGWARTKGVEGGAVSDCKQLWLQALSFHMPSHAPPLLLTANPLSVPSNTISFHNISLFTTTLLYCTYSCFAHNY